MHGGKLVGPTVFKLFFFFSKRRFFLESFPVDSRRLDGTSFGRSISKGRLEPEKATEAK